MDQFKSLFEIALDPITLLMAGAIFIFFRALKKTRITEYQIYWRLLPILPETVGVGLALGGVLPVVEGMPISVKVAVGLWCGYISQRFHKVLGQTILGDDRDIVAARADDECLYCGSRSFDDNRCTRCGATAPVPIPAGGGEVARGEEELDDR